MNDIKNIKFSTENNRLLSSLLDRDSCVGYVYIKSLIGQFFQGGINYNLKTQWNEESALDL